MPFFKRKTRGSNSRLASILGGIVFMLFGFLLFASSVTFQGISTPAELYVVHVDSKRGDEGGWLYRPRFQVKAPDGQTVEFSGNSWHYPKPHTVGETVPGRAHWETGRLKSDKMLNQALGIGILLMLLGGFTFLRGLFGRA